MKLNKNLLGNVVIIVSILLVLLCLAMLMVSGPLSITEVKWDGDGYTYMITPDMEYTMDENSFNITSPYDSNNFQMKKTNDLSNYNKHLGYTDLNNVYHTPRNLSHTYIVNTADNYVAIVPTDSFKMVENGYKLKGNPEIIEIETKSADGIITFLSSSYR